MNTSSELPKKKVYAEPKLCKYGSLTEMTTANSMAGAKDAGPSSSKTI